MHDLSLLQQIYLTYLGHMYAFTFRTRWTRFWGISLSSWLQFGAFLILLAAWFFGSSWWLLTVLLIVVLWIRFSYRRAAKVGYYKFVEDKTAVFPTTNFIPLAPNERVKARATGLFALSDMETNVLLRPADYWKVPLGEHTVMVENGPEQFLYQFFNKATLEKVQAGWLIFGREPRRALSVTFCSKWGPTFTDFSQLYYINRGNNEPPCQRRTIVFTFAGDQEHTAVWHNISQDLNER